MLEYKTTLLFCQIVYCVFDNCFYKISTCWVSLEGLGEAEGMVNSRIWQTLILKLYQIFFPDLDIIIFLINWLETLVWKEILLSSIFKAFYSPL